MARQEQSTARSAGSSSTTGGRRESGRRGLVVAVSLVSLLGPLAACSDDDDSTSTEGTAVSSTTAPSPTSSTAGSSTSGAGPSSSSTAGNTTPEPTVEGIDPMDDGGLDPVSGEGSGGGVSFLSDVRAARHEGYDRVVFEFENSLPGYDVGYQDPPIIQDGSGEEVTIDGSAYLVVRMEPASAVDMEGEELREVYTGPNRVVADTPEVTEIVRTGDFEAVATWVIGSADRVNFRVIELDSPPRLIIDLQNH
jgi:hypothetical protein